MIYQSESVINKLNMWEYQQTEIRFIMKSREHRFWKYLLVNSRGEKKKKKKKKKHAHARAHTHARTHAHTHTHTHTHAQLYFY
jgi:hypothetical protein